MPTRGKNNPNGRALRGRRAHTTFISDPIAQLWSNYNVRSGATGAIAPEQPAVQNCLYDRFEALYKKSSIKPSLLIVPARFQGGSLYSQIPTSGAGDFTVTRATTPTAGRSTRINKDGLIELVADNVPRLDYPLGGAVNGCPALLVEPSGSNSMLYSQAINSWTKSGLTITDNFAISPDGTQSASYIQQTTGGGIVNLQSAGVNISSGQAQSVTFFAKAAEITGVTLRFGTGSLWGPSGTRPQFTFNLTNGSITLNAGSATVSSQNFGNGWYRYSIVTPVTIASGQTTIQTVTNAVFSPNSGDGFYLWGVQWEQNISTPTSYIPTTTQSITRGAEVISRTSASALIGQTEGTIYAEIDARNFTTNARLISISDGTQSNRITTLFFGSNVVRLLATVGGLGQVAINSSSLSAGTIKLAIGYALNNYAFYVNGVQAGTSSSGLVPACSAVILGSVDSLTGSAGLNDRIRAAALYTTRLSNAELAFITQP